MTDNKESPLAIALKKAFDAWMLTPGERSVPLHVFMAKSLLAIPDAVVHIPERPPSAQLSLPLPSPVPPPVPEQRS
jgi:hypothetical protein